MKINKVTIIGLGLIGGSLAQALRERLDVKEIIAVSRSVGPLNRALSEGVIDKGFCEISDEVYDSDIIFICTPVKHLAMYVDKLAPFVKPGCILTDVGSTKSEIIGYVNRMNDPPCFIGGHPMAGSEKSGFGASFSHLFENAYYVLSPGKNVSSIALNYMIELVNGLGAIPVVIDASDHDRITGGISHVPHIIASALVNMVKTMDSDGRMRMLAAGGFKDITRIASSDPEMWENIVTSNSKQVKSIIDEYIKILQEFTYYINSNASRSIYDFFESARLYRDTFTSNKNGLINPIYDIIVDVVDKPGIIGEIATILGKNNINIKNINVSNSREFEQGCLRITLPDLESVNFAFDLLLKKGYKVFR